MRALARVRVKDFVDNCVIVCSMPLTGSPKGMTEPVREAFSIAVDGGLKHFKKLRAEPNVWVGDGDSLKKLPKGGEMQVAKLPPKKDYSDLEAALQIAGQAFFEGVWSGDVILLGAQGGRFDHDIVTMLSVQRWLQAMASSAKRADCPDVVSYGVHGMWLATTRGMAFEQPKGKFFSIVAFESGTKVSVSGARYNVRNLALEPGAMGLSNEGTGKMTKVSVVKGKGPVFVIFPASGS